jgi:cobalt-zinc-cadmium efflux system protein
VRGAPPPPISCTQSRVFRGTDEPWLVTDPTVLTEATEAPAPVAALAITATFLVVEVLGGLLTGSLALLADAGHMATDVAALALSLGASWLARRPATPQYSFGYRRAEVLAAFVNAASLLAISVYVFWEAYQRLGDPPNVDSGPMFAVAVAGLAANAASAAVLARGGGHSDDLNTRGAFLHVVGDALGSVGAIVAALVMLATDWYLADPILSAGIGILIVWSSWRLLCESVDVLLESTPDEMDSDAVRSALTGVDGVEGVHDLHIWTVSSGFVSLSAHVELAEGRQWEPVLLDLSAQLRERFGIVHVTLQPETVAALPDSFRGCSIDTPEGREICQVPAGVNDVHHHAHGH